MKDKKEITCIGCPMGCNLLIEVDDKGDIIVTGNKCNKGRDYGITEYTNPRRVITTTVDVIGGDDGRLSVKSRGDIPKDKIFQCLKLLKDVKVLAPVKIGDIIYLDIKGTGIDIIATKNIDKAID